MESAVSAMIIRIESKRDFLCRVRDLGLVFLPKSLSNSAKCLRWPLNEYSMGQWLSLDVVYLPGTADNQEGAKWVATKIKSQILPLFTEIVFTSPHRNRYVIQEVPAVVTNTVEVESGGIIGFLFSEDLGRITFDSVTSKGFNRELMRSMEDVIVTVQAVPTDDYDFVWRAEEMRIPEGEKPEFPSLKKFRTPLPPSTLDIEPHLIPRPPYTLDEGAGYLEIPELGGKVYFSFNDCKGSLRGRRLREALQETRGLEGFAVPAFYDGKGKKDKYRAVLVRPADIIPEEEAQPQPPTQAIPAPLLPFLEPVVKDLTKPQEPSTQALGPESQKEHWENKLETISSLCGKSAIAAEMDRDYADFPERIPSLPPSTDQCLLTPRIFSTPPFGARKLDSGTFPDPQLVEGEGSDWGEKKCTGIQKSGRSLIGSDFEESFLTDGGHSPYSGGKRGPDGTGMGDSGIGNRSRSLVNSDLMSFDVEEDDELDEEWVREVEEELEEAYVSPSDVQAYAEEVETPTPAHTHGHSREEPSAEDHGQDSETHGHLNPSTSTQSPALASGSATVQDKQGVDVETQASRPWSDSEILSNILGNTGLMERITRSRPDAIALIAKIVRNELD